METTQYNQPGQFLTLLCILTFIGSGILVLSGLNNYREADLTSALVREQMQKSKKQMQERSGNPESLKIAERIVDSSLEATNPDKVKRYSLATMLCNLITFFGAVLMLRLRKAGFWLYLAGTLALVVSPFLVYGTTNILSYSMALGMGVIGIVFLVLYARNLRYMR